MNFLRRFALHRSALLGLVMVAVYAGIALEAHNLAPRGLRASNQIGVMTRLPQPPSSQAPLGTSREQIDVYSYVVWGTRDALRFSLSVALGAAFLGILVGTCSASAGGWLSGAMMRVTDGFLTVPILTGLVVLRQVQSAALSHIPGLDLSSAFSTPRPTYLNPEALQAFQRIISFDALLWAMILFTWMPYARMLNAVITSLKAADFVEAARAMGAGGWRIATRHLLPNAISPVFVLLARDIGSVVVLQASLTFAGFGGNSTWGLLLLQGRDYIIGAGGNPFGFWWVWLPGTLALVLYGISWNLIGDGLTAALNVRA